ncbi:hypothetical protein PROFUN_04208 [Planoprotostelium fungivorum]|uniref:Wiskott-Aldrich syndrome protein n=1 Tax=Planoprotostelium fungivorum TaxID=1890364 RepID=A0A2P6NVW9_9EUKA|nr:hypothetical protein PROFUN_04208 [Planoprotostelium fungivorum]
MSALNASEKGKLESSLGPSLTVLSSTVARLYFAENGQWMKAHMGAVSLSASRDGPSCFLKCNDITSGAEYFSQELYDNFDYSQPCTFFHMFEGEDKVVGLSFASDSDAADFARQIMTKSRSGAPALPPTPNKAAPAVPPPPAKKAPPPPPVHHAPVAQPPPPTPTSAYAPPPPQQTQPQPTVYSAPKQQQQPAKMNHAQKKSTRGLFSSILNKIVGEAPEEELTISEPTGFRHESSIGWNNGTAAFEIHNIPPEWRKLFQAAGIKKSELKNKDTAAFVMNIINENAALETSGAAPPPPPNRGAAPPPPPPALTAPPSSGGPPPPPPPAAPPAPAPPPPFVPHAAPAPPAVSSGGNAGGGGGGVRANLLSSIQKGTQLKHVEESTVPIPPPTANLADTLARAMENRRAAIKEVAEGGDEEEEWSDEEWGAQ